jgi:hypothetical protein
MRRPAVLLLLAALLGPSAACSNLLPRSTSSNSPFRTFEEAKEAFDAVEVGRTRTGELVDLRIDPQRQGVTLLSGAQLISLYLPNDAATLALHDEGVQRCGQSPGRCQGWVVDVERDRRRRKGVWLLDALRIKRVRERGGFDFTGVLLVLDDVVVHKIWSGVPRRRVESTRIQPLSFLQEGASVNVGNPLLLPPFTLRVRAGAARAEALRARPSDEKD